MQPLSELSQRFSRGRTRRQRRQSFDGSFFTRHPMAVCAGCAALAVFFVLAYVAQVNARTEEARADMLARYGGEQVEVCVATRDILAGQTVDAAACTMRVWVADLLPSGAIRSASEVVGRKATSSILAGEVICEGRFAADTVTFEVPFGMTAVSVPAKEVQAVGGAIEPGMRIDIYATGSASTTLIGSDVLVLATSRQPGGVNDAGVGSSSQAIQWITLALSPERVEETVAAAQGLTLYFALPGEGVEAVTAAAGTVATAVAAELEDGFGAAEAAEGDGSMPEPATEADSAEKGANDAEMAVSEEVAQ